MNVSFLVPISVGIRFFVYQGNAMRVLLAYLIFGLITNCLSIVLASSGNNLWLFYIYTPIEYALIIGMLCLWQRKRLIKLLYATSAAIILLLSIFDAVILEDVKQFNTYTCLIESLFLLIGTFIVFNNNQFNKIRNTPALIVSINIIFFIIYFLPPTIIFNAMIPLSEHSVKILWTFVNSSIIVSNIIYTIAFIIEARNTKKHLCDIFNNLTK